MQNNNSENNKIKRYIDCNVPVKTCNFRCHYCCITQRMQFDDKLPEFKYSAEHIGKALSKERFGGTCFFSFCAEGETLLPPEMPAIIKAVLEQGHYVSVVTNGSVSKRFDEIASFPKELLSRLFFKFSFQFLELKRLKMMDKFFDNINKMKEAGCSFSLELTPNDEVIPYFDEIKEVCLSKVGALCHVSVARDNGKQDKPILTNYSEDKYKEIWSTFDSKMFEYKLSVFNKKRNEFCYAGDWISVLSLGTGHLSNCYKGKVIQNIYEDIEEPIRFSAIGNNCKEPHCFNAHVFLTFGAIPEHESPTYADMRNRITTDNTEWLTPQMKEFMNSKLKDSNALYTEEEKKKANKKFRNNTRFTRGLSKLKRKILKLK